MERHILAVRSLDGISANGYAEMPGACAGMAFLRYPPPDVPLQFYRFYGASNGKIYTFAKDKLHSGNRKQAFFPLVCIIFVTISVKSNIHLI